MKTRTKSAFLLLAILVLGIAIGMLVSGVLHNRRMDRLVRIRTGPGIVQLVERAVQPQSEEQRAQIREIMEAAAPRFAETFRQTQEQMRTLSDSVMSELEAILTPEQLENLKEHMMMRRRGPPPSDEWQGKERLRRRTPGDSARPPRDGGPPPPDGGPPPS